MKRLDSRQVWDHPGHSTGSTIHRKDESDTHKANVRLRYLADRAQVCESHCKNTKTLVSVSHIGQRVIVKKAGLSTRKREGENSHLQAALLVEKEDGLLAL